MARQGLEELPDTILLTMRPKNQAFVVEIIIKRHLQIPKVLFTFPLKPDIGRCCNDNRVE